ncbi:hypothetical protein M0638_14130 [Roseomonas sp. NAR14]|uniref:Uncharacterized protein n=1 Tax=Roseomonas acroporae TaxID=2937791 RepID=A0A9X1Y7C4_9PROT|nr:hypothetical protein [Roseomonas acroporae]MCK8785524.1 hypothetical protein [Roseomonas acroporae]
MACLLGATPARADCADPRDLLLGDSIADRMRAAAQADGFAVIARNGAQLAWTTRQPVGCVADLVLVIGTNDLRDLRTPEQARDYVAHVAAAIAQWRPRRALWVTPSCFDPARNPVLSRGGALLHAALPGFPTGARQALLDGQAGGCPSVPAGDGVHPDPALAARWWRDALARLRADAPAASGQAGATGPSAPR